MLRLLLKSFFERDVSHDLPGQERNSLKMTNMTTRARRALLLVLATSLCGFINAVQAQHGTGGGGGVGGAELAVRNFSRLREEDFANTFEQFETPNWNANPTCGQIGAARGRPEPSR